MTPLPADAVELYVLHDDETASLPPLCEAILAADETARLAALTRPKVRRQFLLARALVRTTLSRYAEVPPGAWRFVVQRYGKPEIASPAIVPALRFNLAHTQGMLVLAVARHDDIGVDVEATGRRIELARLSQRFFAPSEAVDVARREGSNQRDRFFTYWTLKEAYIKARGLGLRVPLRHFWFAPDADPVAFFVSPELHDEPAAWQFVCLASSVEHKVAVALRRASPPLRLSVEELSVASLGATLEAWYPSE